MKEFAGGKFIVTKIMICVVKKKKKNGGKKRKCCLPAISPFSTKFSKALCFRVIKVRDCVVKS